MVSIDGLAASPIFAGLGHHGLSEIARAMTLESWPKNCQISTPANSQDRFRIVLRGRVKISRSNETNGRDLTLWLLGKGDGFDIVPLLDGQPHAVSASALDEVQTLAAPVTQFREWIERFPPLRQAICHYAARQMRDLTDLAADMALHDTMTRLARLLLRHLDHPRPGENLGPNLIRDLSHEELASLVGSVRVVVSRLLGQLKREKTIGMNNGAFHIIDLKRLLKHAEATVESGRPRVRSDGTGA